MKSLKHVSPHSSTNLHDKLCEQERGFLNLISHKEKLGSIPKWCLNLFDLFIAERKEQKNLDLFVWETRDFCPQLYWDVIYI